jgi:restriction endonuclease S subunit
MPNIKFSLIKMDLLFHNKRGNISLTKKFCNSHKGIYEVFTGTTIGTFASIDTYEFEKPNLTYTTDGMAAGSVSLITGKYSIGAHRAVLLPKSEEINLSYFKYILEPIFKSVVKNGSVPSITWDIIKKLEIPMPVDDKGNYNRDIQKQIADNYKIVEDQKKIILD